MKKETFQVLEKDVLAYMGVDKIPEDMELYVGVYEIREWSFGEREKIIGSSSVQKMNKKGEMESTLNSARFRLNVMQTCIRRVASLGSAPTKSFLEDMPVWLGEAIWEKVNAINEQSFEADESKKFSLN